MTVTDNNGNTSNCNATVTVLDTIKPVVACQNISVYLDSNGQAVIDSSSINLNSSDNCGITTMTLSSFNGTFGCNNIGTNSITLVVKDASGNVDSCASTVTVIDTIKPDLICKDTTIYLDLAGQFTIDSSYAFTSANSACGIATVKLSKYNFTCIDTGVIQVTVTATDNNNNISVCTANVTVIDSVNPVVSCSNINLYLDHLGLATIDSTDIDNGSTDNCSIETIKLNKTQFDCSNIGPNLITMTVADVNGNIDSCIATVTVLDTVKPIVNCKNINLYLDSNGQYTIDSSYVDNGSTDNCGITTLTLSDSIFTCSMTGVNYVTLMATDSSGNYDTCIATINVVDTIIPNVVCKDTTVYLDSLGIFDLTPAHVDNGSWDNCNMIMSVTPNRFACSDTGTHVVTLIIRDSSNNVDSCFANVTIRDTSSAVVLCKDITVYLDSTGSVAIVPMDVDNGSYDNCGIPMLSISKNYFYCSDAGPNNVTLYAEDMSGNIDSCIAVVTVLDTIAPVVICPADFRDSLFDGCTYTVPDFIAEATIYDNCGYGDLTIVQTPAPYTVIDMHPSAGGQNPLIITIEAEDDNNNQASCSFVVQTDCFPTVVIPQFFSPNGDGINDKWEIGGILQYPRNKVELFNKWGQMVYIEQSYTNGWGGEPNSGIIARGMKSDNVLPSGTYFYKLKLGDGFGTLTGFVHIRY